MLFEQGILSHDIVGSDCQAAIENMKVGFRYFSEWHQEMVDKGKYKIVCILVS